MEKLAEGGFVAEDAVAVASMFAVTVFMSALPLCRSYKGPWSYKLPRGITLAAVIITMCA